MSDREERATSNEEKLRMFVYTMEVASKRADASGMLHCRLLHPCSFQIHMPFASLQACSASLSRADEDGMAGRF